MRSENNRLEENKLHLYYVQRENATRSHMSLDGFFPLRGGWW